MKVRTKKVLISTRMSRLVALTAQLEANEPYESSDEEGADIDEDESSIVGGFDVGSFLQDVVGNALDDSSDEDSASPEASALRRAAIPSLRWRKRRSARFGDDPWPRSM
jgi:hypothetical protein